MSSTRFWLLSQSENKLLSHKLNNLVQRWRSEWFRESISSTVALVSPTEVETAKYRWMRATVDQRFAVAVGTPVGTKWGLGFGLTGVAETGGDRDGEIARGLEIEVLRALAQTALEETGRVQSAEPVQWSDLESCDSFDAHQGYVAAECEIQGFSGKLSLVLYPETTAAYVAELPRPARVNGAVVPARRAIESQPVRVNVVLGEAELLLQEVATLAVGDVLRLDCSIAEPLQVVVPDGGVVSRAHLGAAGDRKAVQLVFAPY